MLPTKATPILSILVALGMACSWMPTSGAGGSSPPVTSDELELAQPTRTPTNLGNTVSGTTDPNGDVTFQDPLSGEDVTVTVQDAASDQGLAEIEVAYLSNGGEFLILVADPASRYFPVVVDSVSLAATDPLTLISYQEQVAIGAIVIGLRVASAILTVQDFIELYQEPPRLERWGLLSTDSCWTGEQMAQAVSVGLLAGELFIGLPGFAELGKHFLAADQAMLDMLQVAQLGAEWELGERLSLFNGVLRIRTYHAPFPIVLPVGWCLEPLDSSNAQSVVDWLQYGLKYDELFVFRRLELGEYFQYVNYIEGGQPVSPEEFLSNLEPRLPNGPGCAGYREDATILQVWTTGWAPPLEITEICYAGCNALPIPYQSSIAAFMFGKRSQTWELEYLWLNYPSEYAFADGVGLTGCNHISSTILDLPPRPTQEPTETARACSGGLSPRLVVGGFAYVIPEPPLANRVRSGPGIENEYLGEAAPGALLKVLEGPVCADGWSWWKVNVLDTGLVGWTAEGDWEEYWLAPCSNRENCPP